MGEGMISFHVHHCHLSEKIKQYPRSQRVGNLGPAKKQTKQQKTTTKILRIHETPLVKISDGF